ncbi:MAG: DUF2202 domain-containing protein [Actinomycetales bacterium]|nr:DUF2202 domain-containing protein [Actinomycetales bacterium]
MRTTRIIASTAAGVLTLTAFGTVAMASTSGPAVTAVAVSATDPQLTEDLQFMREEERLARDLYLLFAERYPEANVFANIARSEDRHHTAVGRQLENFGISDPSAGLAAGDYAFVELDELYTTLAAQGETLEGAIKAGIAVEEEDIADLKAALERESSDPVERTFAALLAGSENHLQAFTTALENGGDCECTGSQNRQGADDRGNGNRRGPNGQGVGQGAGVGGPRGQGVGGPGTGDCDGTGATS